MIHTPTPTTTLRPDFDFVNPYVSAQKLVPKATSYSLKETSSYGAIVFINIPDIGPKQLTKKKVPWGDLAHYFYDQPTEYEKAEIKKHGLIICI